MHLLNLGGVPWQESQLIYHALAHLGREALCLVTPGSPYVCLGRHQDAAVEVDLNYCRANGIPVFRREVGGGAVYLDGRQLFYQLILRKDNPRVPLNKSAFYRKFLEPVITVYRRIGIPAAYKPVNDVVVETRKISGTGVAEIGDCVVFVGNLIVDFNYEMMSRVLKVPDEKFRDKVKKTIEENLSTIKRELGEAKAAQWDDPALNGMLIEEFSKILDPMEEKAPDNVLKEKVQELAAAMINDDWLFRRGRTVDGREIRIRAGVDMVHRMHKAVGGLIRADFRIVDGRYDEPSFSGDWFCYPEDAVRGLESRLAGQTPEDARAIVTAFYQETGADTPGVEVDDWLAVLS